MVITILVQTYNHYKSLISREGRQYNSAEWIDNGNLHFKATQNAHGGAAEVSFHTR